MRALLLASPLVLLACANVVGADFDEAHIARRAPSSGGAAATMIGGAGSSGNAGNSGGVAGAFAEPSNAFQLTVSLPNNPLDASETGQGRVTSADGKIHCQSGNTLDAECSAAYVGHGPTLLASPMPGSAFHSWGTPTGQCAPASPSCALPNDLNGEQDLQAFFVTRGANLWATQFGVAGDDNAQTLAFDDNGNLFVSGLSGVLQTDMFSVDSPTETAFLAQYDALGHLRNSIRFGEMTSFGAREGLALSALGEPVLSGEYDASMAILPLSGLRYDGAGYDAYVAELSPDLSARWIQEVGGSGQQFAGPVAVSPIDGSVYATFTFDDIIDSLGDPLVSAGGSDIALVKFDSQGTVIWAAAFGDSGDQLMGHHGLALSNDGGKEAVILTGSFASRQQSGSFSFNSRGGACPPLANPSTLQNLFVAGLDADDGSCLFARQVGTADNPVQGESVAVLPGADGPDLVLGGTFNGAVDFGPADKDPHSFISASDSAVEQAFIVRLTGKGAWLPGRSFALGIGEADKDLPRYAQFVRQVAVDTDANLVAAFAFIGSIAVGGTSYRAVGETDMLLAKFDQRGDLLYAHAFGTSQTEDPLGLACDASGACAIAGEHGSDTPPQVDPCAPGNALNCLDFGGIGPNPLPSPQAWDAVVAKFSP